MLLPKVKKNTNKSVLGVRRRLCLNHATFQLDQQTASRTALISDYRDPVSDSWRVVSEGPCPGIAVRIPPLASGAKLGPAKGQQLCSQHFLEQQRPVVCTPYTSHQSPSNPNTQQKCADHALSETKDWGGAYNLSVVQCLDETIQLLTYPGRQMSFKVVN